jgi:hypothetical protein
MLLAVKLLLTPSIVVLATLAGRRFGRSASGWLIGLPLTSGPITAFFAVEHGTRFAARAAVGSLGGAIAEVAYCIGYTAVARRAGWPYAVAGGSLSFAVVAAALEALPLDARPEVVAPLAGAAVLSLFGGIALVPPLRPSVAASQLVPSRSDLAARAVAATVFLLVLTGLATTLGPRLSGLLAVYPLYSVVLAAFAQRLEGAAGAVQVLRGLLLGLFSFVCFYTSLAAALPALGVTGAFALATTLALLTQAVSLRPLARLATV